mgnify:CR=1 FL=1
MKTREHIHVVGKVKSVSDPFYSDKTTKFLITVETKRGLYSLPVSQIQDYAINQEVEIILTIRTKEAPE